MLLDIYFQCVSNLTRYNHVQVKQVFILSCLICSRSKKKKNKDKKRKATDEDAKPDIVGMFIKTYFIFNHLKK